MIQISWAVAHRLLVGFRKQVNDHTVIDPDAREEYLSSAILLDSVRLEPENIDVEFQLALNVFASDNDVVDFHDFDTCRRLLRHRKPPDDEISTD
jgi:hypothetical protein